MACNGMLAGLVAITAPCAFVGAHRVSDNRRTSRRPGLRRRPLQRASPKNRRPLRRHLRARLLRLARRGLSRNFRRRHLRRRLERRRRSKLSRPRRPRRNRPTPRRRQPILDATRRRNSTSSLRLRIHVHNLQSSKRSKVNESKQRSRTTRPRRPRIRHASVPRRRSRHAHRRLASPTKVGAGGSPPARSGRGCYGGSPRIHAEDGARQRSGKNIAVFKMRFSAGPFPPKKTIAHHHAKNPNFRLICPPKMPIQREYHRWFSHRLGHDMAVIVYGHWGPPLLSFPTSGGDEWEYENQGMVGALSDLIEAGKVKLFNAGTVSGEGFYNKCAHPFHRSYVQAMFDSYIREEVVPFIWDNCKTQNIGISTFGASLGAYQAVNTLLKHPDVIKRTLRPLRPIRHEQLHERHVRRQFLFQQPSRLRPKSKRPLDAKQSSHLRHPPSHRPRPLGKQRPNKTHGQHPQQQRNPKSSRRLARTRRPRLALLEKSNARIHQPLVGAGVHLPPALALGVPLNFPAVRFCFDLKSQI